MKDDAGLRQRMGAQGGASVSSRTIPFVVQDLLRWYEAGRQRKLRRRTQPLFSLVTPVVLAALVPLTVLLFYFYNISVSTSPLPSFLPSLWAAVISPPLIYAGCRLEAFCVLR